MLDFTPVATTIVDKLAAIVGKENVSTGESELDLHSHDQSFHEPHRAEVIVWANNAQEVADVLKLAHNKHIPVTPWGVGSSLEGNPIPIHGGILLSLRNMNHVIDVHADDFQVTVQPGKPYKDMNKDLSKHGLFFPPDPGANATIGGMLANNAAGIRTVKYGASKDNVLALQVALADGRLIRTGSRSIKQSAGYNLTQVFVGSEGTLGIITEATLKLSPVPEYSSTMIAAFETVEVAIEAVVLIKGSGVDVAALEFLDTPASQTLASRGLDIEPSPTLLMEVHNAHAESQEADVATVREICDELDAASFIAIVDHTQAQAIWHARHQAYETLIRAFPDMKFHVMDVAVPLSKYPEIVAFARQEIANAGTMAFLIGHAGDGNIHVTIPWKDADSLAKVKAMNSAIVHKALALDGTATGEHGVGIGKAPYMPDEHGTGLDVMRQLKNMLDPHGILNPGKIFPAD
ncbi:MAG: FAD-binding oxidoreductase [Anaerolineae bacterium]|nr:FAD-binding oxidoreductase [Anaerolineae bacterium]MDQ7035031.1 FAD-binding oxidoreductase [Anaerolineae bacterium]